MRKVPWRVGLVVFVVSFALSTATNTIDLLAFRPDLPGDPALGIGVDLKVMLVGWWVFLLGAVVVTWVLLDGRRAQANLRAEMSTASPVALVITPLAAFVVVAPVTMVAVSFPLLHLLVPCIER
jgi:hypothetical protein